MIGINDGFVDNVSACINISLCNNVGCRVDPYFTYIEDTVAVSTRGEGGAPGEGISHGHTCETGIAGVGDSNGIIQGIRGRDHCHVNGLSNSQGRIDRDRGCSFVSNRRGYFRSCYRGRVDQVISCIDIILGSIICSGVDPGFAHFEYAVTVVT